MKSVLVWASFVASLASVVSAHGSIEWLEADGVKYYGPHPVDTYRDKGKDSPVRQIDTINPITDPMSNAMRCGPKAAASAKLVAGVTAGSDVTFHYRTGEDGSNWVHNTGPMQVFMYKCPPGVDATDCAPPAANEKAWFKITALGFKTDRNEDGWFQEDLYENNSLKATVPKGLQDGAYLMRFELNALHNAVNLGGAEWYVACAQFAVSGGTSARSPADAGADLAAFPGSERGDDPGEHLNPFDYKWNAKTYPMPGPKLFAGDSETASTPTTTATSSSQSDPAPTPTPSKHCKRKRRGSKKSMNSHKRKRSAKIH